LTSFDLAQNKAWKRRSDPQAAKSFPAFASITFSVISSSSSGSGGQERPHVHFYIQDESLFFIARIPKSGSLKKDKKPLGLSKAGIVPLTLILQKMPRKEAQFTEFCKSSI
jgi:hypothetical protein